MRKVLAVTIAILLLIIPVYSARSDSYSVTAYIDKARDIVVLQSSVLTAEISGKQPVIKFYYTGDRLNMTHFRVILEKIVEYTESLEVAQECDVNAWTGIYGSPTPVMSEGGSEVGVGFSQALLKYPSIPFLIVFTEFSMYYSNFTETTQMGAFRVTTATLGGVELRITIRVVDWPFKNPETNRLALIFRIEKEIAGETSEQHRFNFDNDKNILHVVGDDTKVEEGFIKWGSEALTSNTTGYYLTPIETTSLNETGHDAQLTLVYNRMHTNVVSVLEQTLTVGVVEENAEFIVHPTPATLAPEVIIAAAVITLGVLVFVIARMRSSKVSKQYPPLKLLQRRLLEHVFAFLLIAHFNK